MRRAAGLARGLASALALAAPAAPAADGPAVPRPGGASPDAQIPYPTLPYVVVGGAIPAPLTGAASTDAPGDPARGRAIVADRTRGLCLLCHTGPFPEERFQGDLAPDLSGVGARLGAGELRLRLVDGRALNPGTIMPSYYSLEGLTRVGRAWRGRPILDAGEIEDVVAFLASLRGGPSEGKPEGTR